MSRGVNNKSRLKRGRCWLLVPSPAATQTDAGAHTTAAEQQVGVRTKLVTSSIYSPSEKGLSHAKTALCSLSGMRLCIIFLQSDRNQATIDHIKGQNGHTRLDRVNTNTSPAHIRHIRVDTSFLAGTLPSSVKTTLTQVRQTGGQT